VTSNQPNQDDPDASDLTAHLMANNSTIADPGIQRISRDQDQLLDPRPSANGAAYTNPTADIPNGDLFFTQVDYSGAFSALEEELWIVGWTSLERNGHLGLITSVKETADQQLSNSIRIYPNPVSAGSGFELEIKDVYPSRMEVYTREGRLIYSTRDITMGRNTIDTHALSAGMYFLKVITQEGRYYTTKLVIE
jgi:hypothetical protein